MFLLGVTGRASGSTGKIQSQFGTYRTTELLLSGQTERLGPENWLSSMFRRNLRWVSHDSLLKYNNLRKKEKETKREKGHGAAGSMYTIYAS